MSHPFTGTRLEHCMISNHLQYDAYRGNRDSATYLSGGRSQVHWIRNKGEIMCCVETHSVAILCSSSRTVFGSNSMLDCVQLIVRWISSQDDLQWLRPYWHLGTLADNVLLGKLQLFQLCGLRSRFAALQETWQAILEEGLKAGARYDEGETFLRATYEH